MSFTATSKFKSIRDFPELVDYLGDELDWPIETDDFEEMTFEYSAAELGLDEKTAPKFLEIRRLRPLDKDQPWGIFFIRFDDSKLPVVALRRLLSKLVLKKRSTSNTGDRASWHESDLLLISQTGNLGTQSISFAHFAANPMKTDLPILKVLGWDNDDTGLKIDYVIETLHEKLAWPDDPSDSKAWRAQWRDAFTLKNREVIQSSKDMAERLGHLALAVRTRLREVLAIESEEGPIHKLMSVFKENLITDLDTDSFSDMYAQTIAYGLLSARIINPKENTADAAVSQMPITNPFLGDLMETFLNLGGRSHRSGVGLDFDELGINEVVELLDNTNIEAVLRDFGDRNQKEDPVLHFFEGFLQEYDSKIRKDRGVFYTPQPVVSFIVRSLDEQLKTEFGLEDGLADTTTWRELAKRTPDLEIPVGTSPDKAFVQILDVATGTGTFIIEVIVLIHKTMTEKWRGQGKKESQIKELWNEYVQRHLLQRLHGYELMMAPYAIAHMKIGLKLYETGYRFDSDERVRVYLTNALEPVQDSTGILAFAIPALAREAEAVNSVKRNQRFTVVLGNPPYSKASKNLGAQFSKLIEDFRYYEGKRIREPGAILFERDINNDYVKFLGLGINITKISAYGILGMITSNSYLDGKNFRGVRDSLSNFSNSLCIINLHGDSRSGSLRRSGVLDENVFDIETGVSILLTTHKSGSAESRFMDYADIIGTYSSKAEVLNDSRKKLKRMSSAIDSRRYKSFLISDSSVLDEYSKFTQFDKQFGVSVDGIKTSRDGLVIANTIEECASKILKFSEYNGCPENYKELFGISVAKWDYKAAQDHLQKNYSTKFIHKLAYRPFDFRYIYYDPKLVFSDRSAGMHHLTRNDNLALVCASRLSAKGFNHILPADCLVEMKYASHDTNSRVFPSLLYDQSDLFSEHRNNTSYELSQIISSTTMPSLGWDEIVSLTYAVLNSTAYRSRYFEEIKNDFPRVPSSRVSNFTRELSLLGRNLIDTQLLRMPVPGSLFPLYGDIGEVISTPRYHEGNLYISDNVYFGDVSYDIFTFELAGYQICKSWFNAGNRSGIQRKGHRLSLELANSIRQVLFGIQETIQIRKQIDRAIETHGGWPNAFIPAVY